MSSLLERRQRVLGSGLRLYYDAPFEPVRGEGVYMYDAAGKRYLDAYNNVAHVGHCHPRVIDAVCRQAATLNTNSRYLYDSIVEYAERLTQTTRGELDTVLFTCTGSEANDLAWRLATRYTGAEGVITTNRAYHGNTVFLRSIDASRAGPGAYEAQAVVGPAKAHVRRAGIVDAASEYGNEMAGAIESLRGRGHRVAAFFFDTYFCSEGVHAPVAGMVRQGVERVHQDGGLVIADEVQAGLSRSGVTFWGYQQHEIAPDIVTCGKPMGNGHPIGAVLTKREIAEAFFKADGYFNTFAGNPVSNAAGIAVLEVLRDEELQANAHRIGQMLRKGFEDLQQRYECIGAVRGAGLLLGVEIVTDRNSMSPAGIESRAIINELCRRGVLVGLTGPNRAARNILKVRPPMVFEEQHVNQLLATMDEVLSSMRFVTT